MKDWTKEEKNQIKIYIDKNGLGYGSIKRIVNLLNATSNYRKYTYDNVRNILRRDFYKKYNKPTTENRITQTLSNPKLNVGKLIHSKKIYKSRKILVMSDLHIPFHTADMVEQAIEENKDADMLVINGDFLDMYAVSSFIKDKPSDLYEDYNTALEYVEKWKKIFKTIILIKGNHEERWDTYLNKRVGADVSFLVDKDILTRLADGIKTDRNGKIEKKLDFKNVYYIGSSTPWYCMIGDAVIGHPKSFSKTDMKTSVDTMEYFKNHSFEFHVILIGHTHRLGKTYKAGKMIIEGGCLCHPLDYQLSGKLSGANAVPQTLGYTVLYQDSKGITDFNASHIVYLGQLSEEKKTFEEVVRIK